MSNSKYGHRQYLRLDSVFPVQFKIVSLDGKVSFSDWMQGFTHNISKGGIQLDVNNLKSEMAALLRNRQAAVSLRIQMPLSRPAVNAQAEIAWLREAEDGQKCSIGLAYKQISAVDGKKIIHYVWSRVLFLPVIITLAVFLGMGFAVNGYLSMKLIRGNRALVEQLIKILQDSSLARQKIKEINRDKEERQLKIDTLQLRIQAMEGEKLGLTEKVKSEEVRFNSNVKERNIIIEKLGQEKTILQEQLFALQRRENVVTEQLLDLGQKKGVLEKANIDKMYRWIAVHQNPRTGLIMSFEGDSEIANWAFIYDQALALQVYANFSDFGRAKAILEFFSRKAKKVNGFFLNGYYSDDGNPAEYTMHCGPNIWLGVAVCQYVKKTGDNKYLRLAEEIAENIINFQAQDKEGGLRGSPAVEWYSTEHNLDAYAFFNMLYKITGKETYHIARDKILNWLVKHTYDQTNNSIKRGKGDATIATDTYAWSIAAIGPEKLNELGMNPDKILEFAEENCAVEVSFIRPNGQSVQVKGFDFAAKNHIARGGVISSEWTAQMIIAFKIMGEYYHKKGLENKALNYEEKADEYMSELCKMVISSPSPSGQGAGCLPYASIDSVDTGHGWKTPKGKATGSVSATAYTLFAYHNYNPLELK